jgi:hypothetical protein
MSDPHWAHEQAERGQQVQSLFGLMAEVSAGNVRRRFQGVVLIASGLVVQTVANVLAL